MREALLYCQDTVDTQPNLISLAFTESLCFLATGVSSQFCLTHRYKYLFNNGITMSAKKHFAVAARLFRRRNLFYCAAVLLFLPVQIQAVEKPKREKVLAADESWDGVKYTAYPPGRPELTVERITIPANTTLPWHHHPIPSACYVVSGTLVIYKKDGTKSKPYGPGQALAESLNEIHHGAAGDQEVQCVMFFAGTPGTKTTIDEKPQSPPPSHQ
jgi:quercetin dioxygenase-like cupin family protein